MNLIQEYMLRWNLPVGLMQQLHDAEKFSFKDVDSFDLALCDAYRTARMTINFISQ